MNKRIAFFDTKPYDRPHFDALAQEMGISIMYFESKLNEKTAVLAKDYPIVCAFVNDTINKTVIDTLYEGGTQLLAMRCAGYNNIDVKAAYGKIHIVRVPAYSPHAVAEHAMALLLSSVRHIHKGYARTRELNFSLNGLVGFDLYKKKIGVVGTGKIGRVFSEICQGFGMHVLAYDPYPASDLAVEYCSFEHLCKHSDIISLHCPLTEESTHLIDRDSIALMKEGVILINTSRGALIDSQALLEGIRTKKIGSAALDVYEEEAELFYEDHSATILSDDVLMLLISMPNVLVTSHQAFLTEEALQQIAKTTMSSVDQYLGDLVMDHEICYRCDECHKVEGKRCF